MTIAIARIFRYNEFATGFFACLPQRVTAETFTTEYTAQTARIGEGNEPRRVTCKPVARLHNVLGGVRLLIGYSE